MLVNSTTVPAVATSSAGGDVTTSSAASRGPLVTSDEFMTLLVAQLTNQDPLSPMNSEAFISQLSQLEMVSQLGDIREVLQSAHSYTNPVSTLGRTVHWIEPDGSIASGEVTALVKYGGEFKVQAGDRLLDFAQITIIE